MHLYVHIPFCHRICPYCSFYKHTPASTDMRKFVDALLVEASSRSQLLHNSPPASSRTLYFGGGTPSMLSTLHLKRLVEGIYDIVPRNTLDEFSFEANPATFTERKAAAWAELGITRISLGVQSWDPAILKLLGREHSPEEAEQSVNILRKSGIRDINIDLMFSIPGQTHESWRSTLDKTISLNPDHISAYNLTYEEDTAFYEQLRQGQMTRNTETDAELFEYTHNTLTKAGYRHYETSNYARNGRTSLHNLGYWLGEDYVGIGPGAVGTINGQRIHNTADTGLYIESTLANGLPVSEIETLRESDIRIERIALLLRTDMGLPLTLIPKSQQGIIDQLITEKLAYPLHNGRLILTERGQLLVDEIAIEFFPDS